MSELALTGSTTDGVNTVISGLDLRPGDEIITSDEEHPGLLAPLGIRLMIYPGKGYSATYQVLEPAAAPTGKGTPR